MVLSGNDVLETYGVPEVFGLAKGFLRSNGVRRMKGKQQITYYALLFSRHEVIFAEGARTESFRPGPVAMASFESHARKQVFEIHPGLADDPEAALGPPARKILTRREVMELLKRRVLELTPKAGVG